MEVISPTLTIKAVGHQWYWSYELSDFFTDSGDAIDFDSYMIFTVHLIILYSKLFRFFLTQIFYFTLK